MFRQLRRGKFSLAVDFQGYGETAWLAWLSGAPQRWGNVYNQGRRWAYTHGVTRNDRIHHVDWYLSLLEQCGLPPGKIVNEFVLPEAALGEARKFFCRAQFEHRPARPVHPAVYQFTAKKLAARPVPWRWRGTGGNTEWQILFGGGPADRAALEPARQSGFPVSAGVPMLVTGGLMKLSSLILGGDTGALHLAVAMGKRVVMIGDSVALVKTHPFQHADWTITPPAGQILSSLETGPVIQACSQALNELSRIGPV